MFFIYLFIYFSKAILLGTLSIKFLPYSIEMFSYSFWTASLNVSSLENILPGSFHFIIFRMF